MGGERPGYLLHGRGGSQRALGPHWVHSLWRDDLQIAPLPGDVESASKASVSKDSARKDSYPHAFLW